MTSIAEDFLAEGAALHAYCWNVVSRIGSETRRLSLGLSIR